MHGGALSVNEATRWQVARQPRRDAPTQRSRAPCVPTWCADLLCRRFPESTGASDK